VQLCRNIRQKYFAQEKISNSCNRRSESIFKSLTNYKRDKEYFDIFKNRGVESLTSTEKSFLHSYIDVCFAYFSAFPKKNIDPQASQE